MSNKVFMCVKLLSYFLFWVCLPSFNMVLVVFFMHFGILIPGGDMLVLICDPNVYFIYLNKEKSDKCAIFCFQCTLCFAYWSDMTNIYFILFQKGNWLLIGLILLAEFCLGQIHQRCINVIFQLIKRLCI